MNCELIKKELIDEVLANKPMEGKHKLEPLKSLANLKKLPFNIIEDYQVEETGAEIHKNDGDLWCCLDGEAKFTYGGKLIKPVIQEGSNGKEIIGKGIAGGISIKLKKGDWFWIPPDQPHMHSSKKMARLLIIKVPRSD